MIWSYVFWILGFYLCIVLLVYFFQDKLLYFPDKTIIAHPGYIGYNYEDVEFNTTDNVKLHGWYIPADTAEYTLLFFHGNAGNISHRLESIHQFLTIGLNVFIIDYRGFGKSDGKPSEQGTYLDAEAAWNYLVNEKNANPENIIIFGRSLGAAVACQLATNTKPAAIIMESAFLSVPDLAAKLYPFLPARWLSRFNYKNNENIQTINCLILIIHSRGDEIIPYSHGEELFSLAKEPKQFLEIMGSHNDGFYVSKEKYMNGIRNFLETIN